MAEINPDKWLVGIAGFVNDWFYSRKWSRIFLNSIPALMLILFASAVFAGGVLNRFRLRNSYLKMAEAESARWQEQLTKSDLPIYVAAGGSEATLEAGLEGQNSQAEPNTTDQAENKENQLSPFAEMLLRRAHYIEPSEETQFYVGALMWQRGAISNARQTLQKIAPKDKKGYPPAHTILAKICRDEYINTRDPALFEEFQHHANIAVSWPKAFPEVLLEQANVLWHQNRTDQALTYLLQASKNYPDFYGLLVERAKQAGKTVLAQTARKNGIEHFQTQIAKGEDSESNRIQLAQLLILEPEGDAAGEQILIEGHKQKPSRLYARALSEVYRMRFEGKLERSGGQIVDIALLEQALQLDSGNSKIAQTVAGLINRGIQASEQLGAELNRVLATGQATMATHAILSEYHLQNGRLNEARTHLEQVYKLAPMAVKYANNLAYLYSKEGRQEDAEKIVVQTLTLLKQNGTQKEPFTDELFDTLGMIYQTQGKLSDAIAAYEASLRLNQERPNTRSQLIVLYRQSGNEGVAKAHEEAILAMEKLKAEFDPTKPGSTPPVPTSQGQQTETPHPAGPPSQVAPSNKSGENTTSSK